VRYLLQRAQTAGALPEGFGIDQAVRLWRLIRAHADAVQSYEPGSYPGRLILFAATDSERDGVGPDLGWGRLATGGIELVTLDARHSTVLRGSAVRTIANVLTRCLDGGERMLLAPSSSSAE
jgi:thioesterase domain-containing protein